jgi:hypothetical protein
LTFCVTITVVDGASGIGPGSAVTCSSTDVSGTIPGSATVGHALSSSFLKELSGASSERVGLDGLVGGVLK